MNIPSFKKHIFFSTTTFTLLIFAVVFFIIWPNSRDIVEASDAIKKERAQLERQYEQGQLRKKNRESLTLLESRLPLLHTPLLTRSALLALVDQLETRAKKYGLTEQFDINIQNRDEEQKEKTPFLLTLAGSFPESVRFLHDLETLPWYFIIESIQIEKGIPPPTSTRTPRAPEEAAAPQSPIRVFIRGYTFVDQEESP